MIGEDGDQMGVMSLDDAKAYAYDRELDLVMVAAQAQPPVCRAMDYGKYCYEQSKKAKEAKKKQQVVEIKEVQLSCRIDTHDFETKVKRAIRFLSDGDKVRVCLRFKGREMVHQEFGLEMMERFADACSDFGCIDKKPTLEGRQLTMFIGSKKKQIQKSSYWSSFFENIHLSSYYICDTICVQLHGAGKANQRFAVMSCATHNTMNCAKRNTMNFALQNTMSASHAR